MSSSNPGPSGKLQGKIALVTASTEGIGFAAARGLAQQGALVVLSSRQRDKVDRAVAELRSQNLNVTGTTCHVGKREDRERLVATTVRDHGGIDILVSNAAVNPFFGNIMDSTEEVWDKILDVNVKATFLLVKLVVPHMEARGGGSIVIISSIAGYQPFQMAALSGWVCVVTGASRGIGKGIALQLGSAGATVYITGRNGATLGETAKEVEARGGACVPVTCDSSKEDDIRSLFERIGREQRGRLDILVNNAYAGVQMAALSGWVCVVTGASRGIGKGIALQLGSAGATVYITGRNGATLGETAKEVEARGGACVPVTCDSSKEDDIRSLFERIGREQRGRLDILVNNAYAGVQCDRLACDGAVELRGAGVAMVSLWPGAVRTESITEKVLNRDPGSKAEEEIRKAFADGETPELSGKCIVELAADKKLMSLSGKVLLTCDLCRRYNLQDVDGRKVVDYMSLGFLVSRVPGFSWLSPFIPSFLRLPKFVLTLTASKF
ncbi:UNVERIFIED_CONTAM: hypothetical protein FKN15_000585 [Acipenser sinensis]